MSEDTLHLELDFRDEPVRDLVYVMFCGDGPSFRKDVPASLRALFDVMERANPANTAERIGRLRLRAMWDLFVGEDTVAREMCAACSAAGATVWARYHNEWDTTWRVWTLDNGPLRQVFPGPSEPDASFVRFHAMRCFDVITILRKERSSKLSSAASVPGRKTTAASKKAAPAPHLKQPPAENKKAPEKRATNKKAPSAKADAKKKAGRKAPSTKASTRKAPVKNAVKRRSH
jgi:hypothetical protein